jgi:nucleoid-associated protein YgaU
MHAPPHAQTPRLRRHRRHAAIFALLPALVAAPAIAQEPEVAPPAVTTQEPAAPSPAVATQEQAAPPQAVTTQEPAAPPPAITTQEPAALSPGITAEEPPAPAAGVTTPASAPAGQAKPSTEIEALRQQLANATAQASALAERAAGLDKRVKEAERARAEAEKAKAKAEEAKGKAEQAKGKAEKDLAKAEEDKAGAQQELTTRAQEILTLQADLARAREETGALERRLAQVQDLKRENREREEALSKIEAERKAQEDQLAALRQSQQDLARQAKEREEALSREIATLRARLPAQEGGTVTAEEARSEAAAAGTLLLDALRAGGRGNTEQRKGVRDAENRLFQAQMLLSRTLGARSLYRVWPQDTLAQVSLRVYGDSGRWKAIYEANAHVLDNPNHLVPGMTLVIP